jgi:hypothetical protein
MSAPNIKVGAVLPYCGEIEDATRVAVLKLANASLPTDLVGRLKVTTADIHRLDSAIADLSLDSVRRFHGAAREADVNAIISGANPVSPAKHLDTLGREFASRRATLTEAKARVFTACLDDLERVGALLASAVSALSAKTESAERAAAEEFHVAFTASPQLCLIQSVGLLVQHRFTGIREHAKSNAANMGSPASFLADLIPGVADW